MSGQQFEGSDIGPLTSQAGGSRVGRDNEISPAANLFPNSRGSGGVKQPFRTVVSTITVPGRGIKREGKGSFDGGRARVWGESVDSLPPPPCGHPTARGNERERVGDNAKAGMHAHVRAVFSYVRARLDRHVRTRNAAALAYLAWHSYG